MEDKDREIVNGANPSIIWTQYMDFLSAYARQMKTQYTKRMRENNPFTWSDLDYMNKTIHEKLDELMTWKKVTESMNKKLIRLTESDLHRIVRESVNKVLNEIGDTEKGQYALGAVQARADMRKRNALNNKNFGERGDRDTYNRNDNISGDASKSAFKYNYTGDMDANYDKRKDLYNANQRGYRNYMSYMNGAGNIDYKTAPQTRNEVGY